MSDPNRRKWNRLPPEMPFDIKDREPIYAAVGFSLTQWEFLQTELIRLLGHIVGCPMHHGAIAVLGMTPNIPLVCDGLDMAAKRNYDLPQTLKDEVLDLTKCVREAAKIRNDIAHAAVQRYCDGKNESAWWLAPTDSTSKKISGPEGYAYRWNSKQVRSYGDRFASLRDDTQALQLRIKPRWHMLDPIDPVVLMRSRGVEITKEDLLSVERIHVFRIVLQHGAHHEFEFDEVAAILHPPDPITVE